VANKFAVTDAKCPIKITSNDLT